MPFPSDSNLVDEVSVKEPLRYEKEGAKEVVLVDCGTKANIVRELAMMRVRHPGRAIAAPCPGRHYDL